MYKTTHERGNGELAKLTVRFNYFKMYLQNEREEYVYNPVDLFEYIICNKNKNYSEIVNNVDYGEIDTNAFHIDRNEEIYYFQIAKLRNQNLPDKKRISSPREHLPLDNNEYVSEFLTFIYDKRYLTTIIQVNRNSLTVKELEIYMTQLRHKHREWIGLEKDNYYVKCKIVPDPEKLEEVRQADYFRKIVLSGSKVNLDALQSDNSLKKITDTLGKLEGVNFKLEISVDKHPSKDASLDKTNTLEIIEDINQQNNDVKTSVSIKDDLETSVELVNLVEPRMTDIIKIDHDNRNNIGVEYLYNQFKEKIYLEKREKVRRLLETH